MLGARLSSVLAIAALLGPFAAPGCEGRSGASRTAGTGGRAEGGETVETATFGGGCFWCVEAVLERLDGVLDVVSGYMGGRVPNPTYEQVSTGLTGHAEVVQVTYDPRKIRYEDLLEKFWQLHDPTSLNRQGNDVGSQYRSVIFYHTEAQRLEAEASKAEKERSGAFRRPIVTEIAQAGRFYKAEEYHQDYYRRNPAQPYCRAVIARKLEKLGFGK
ncbi:MAG: peptide-methionine (S)-S-oxide reductase MsrA [Planctomycetota bacterium]